MYFPPQPPPPILFLSPTIITGEPTAIPFVSDVLISNGIIFKIGPDLAASAPEGTVMVEARGLVLCPGFIDMHAHSDLYLLTNPEHEAKISQGVTTEVVGQDGISYCPVHTTAQMTLIRAQIAGWNGNPSDDECKSLHAGKGMFEWRSVKQYLDNLDRCGVATNVAMLVPQGNLRLIACGTSDAPCTPTQLQLQLSVLTTSMHDGAIGLSSGLTYTPGSFAPTSELHTLLTHLSTFPGAYYCPHTRSYGHNALAAYKEMIDLAKSTKVPLHLTHATMNFGENKGRAGEFLEMVRGARGEGVEVGLDTYPYLPGSTTLGALLPSWAGAGGLEGVLEILATGAGRERLRRVIEVEGSDGCHGCPTDWGTIEIAGVGGVEWERYSGKTVARIAEEEGRTGWEVFEEVLVGDRMRTSILQHVGDEGNVREIMMDCGHCGGSDGILHGTRTHPRAYGTFPRFLSHYSLELQLLSLPSMVSHLTSTPARRMGIYPDRGVIAEGSIADLVLFDPRTIKDEATFDEPKRRAKGVEWVLVNGVVVLERGEMNGRRAGKTLRRRTDGRVTAGGL